MNTRYKIIKVVTTFDKLVMLCNIVLTTLIVKTLALQKKLVCHLLLINFLK
jgi:hypothetical protein